MNIFYADGTPRHDYIEQLSDWPEILYPEKVYYVVLESGSKMSEAEEKKSCLGLSSSKGTPGDYVISTIEV